MRNSNIKNTKEKKLAWRSIILLNFTIITDLFFLGYLYIEYRYTERQQFSLELIHI